MTDARFSLYKVALRVVDSGVDRDIKNHDKHPRKTCDGRVRLLRAIVMSTNRER